MGRYLEPKAVFLTTLLVVIYASLDPVLGIGFGSGFDELSFATLYSVGLLGATAWVCFQLAELREGAWRDGRFHARFLWRFLGWAFVFLALDEALQIHENLDKLIHIILAMDETAWTDSIDDVILLSYGLAGLAILVRCRAEVFRVPAARRYLALAFGLFLVSVVFDVLTNRKAYLDWLELEGQARDGVSAFAAIVEEGGKLFTGAALLVGFGSILRAGLEPVTPSVHQ